MPYIKQEGREEFNSADFLRGIYPNNSGELSYLISQLLVRYIEIKGVKYSSMNDALGALDGVSKEFYHRVVRPYEDQKIKENGDVWGGLGE